MKLLKIGYVVKQHGRKGNLFVKIYPKYGLEVGDEVYFENKKIFKGPYKILSIRNHKNNFLVDVGLDSWPEEFKGASIGKKVNMMPKDTYFFDDIIGCDVFDGKDIFLGKVVEIIRTGSNDVYSIKKGDSEILLPATKEVIKKIDIKNKKIIAEPQEEITA